MKREKIRETSEDREDKGQSFFEIMINSQKLQFLLNQFSNQFEEHCIREKKIEQQMQTMKEILQNKIKKWSETHHDMIIELDRKIKESSTRQTQNSKILEKQMNQKTHDLYRHIERLNNNIITSQSEMKSQFLSYLEKTKAQIIGSNENFPFTIQQLVEKIQSQIRTLQGQIPTMFDQMYRIKESQKMKDQKDRKAPLIVEIAQTKKDEVQKSINKIIYPSKKNEDEISEFRVQSKRKKPSGIFREIHESNQGYDKTVENMEKMNEKLKNKTTELEKLKQKIIVVDEKFTFISKRIDKSFLEVNELKSNFKKFEAEKMDEKYLEEIRSSIKWMSRGFDERIEKKCSKEQFFKDKARLNEKLAIMHENMIEKADKAEIQKAIVFLQNKIKELIFFVAGEQSDQRDGAIIKSAIKCLSCDRDVEKNLKPNKQKDQVFRTSFTNRTKTNKLKYRVQEAKRTKTMGNYTDHQTCLND